MPYLITLIIFLAFFFFMLRGIQRAESSFGANTAELDEQLLAQTRSYRDVLGDVPKGAVHCLVFLDGIKGLNIDNIARQMSLQDEMFHNYRAASEGELKKQIVIHGVNLSPRIKLEIVKNPAFQNAEPASRLASSNYYWPEASEDLSNSKLAMLCYCEEAGRALDQSIFLSFLLQTVFSMKINASGAIWNRRQAISVQTMADEFKIVSKSLPCHFWVAVDTYVDKHGQVCGFTEGLEDYAKTEFEAVAAPENPLELRRRLEGFTSYALDGCTEIMNGDTIGGDTHEKVKLQKTTSQLGRPGWVFRMDYL
ncbi:DUF4261 domain-containing protein [uncultured Pseudoteredinibacter sp.]|uniref:DUF4261 domain-containing protein n=1 Tax=uncultured Pseudoteredinibacter sp. TaxID=1641701 RepID=UPI002639093A|nr:DUF4261 domain-containing protein [uncultured Pseudoteredinibacter sp.]